MTNELLKTDEGIELLNRAVASEKKQMLDEQKKRIAAKTLFDVGEKVDVYIKKN
jgi:hypothetical protein